MNSAGLRADEPRPRAWRSVWPDALTLGLFYLLVASLSILLSRQPGSIAAIWFPNAIAVGFMLTAPARRWPVLLAATGIANLAANLFHGSPIADAAVFLPGNLIEVWLGAALLRRAGVGGTPLRSVPAMLRLIALGALIPPTIGATFGAAAIHSRELGHFAAVWLTWYEGSAIGSISVLAMTVGLRQAGGPQLRSELLDLRFIALGLVAAGLTLLSLAKLPFPFVYLGLPLLVAAIVLDMNATLMLVWLVSFVVALALGTGIFVAPPITARWEEVFVYAAYAAALVPAQLLAAAVADMRDAQARLAQATADLKRANEGLEQFVRIASHDLREPLNTIVQFAGLIDEDHGAQLPPDARRWLGMVHSAGTRMRRLLDDVLVYIRLQREGPSAGSPVDLNRVLQDVLASMAGRLRETRAVVEVGELPLVLGHEAPLSLLFQNLLSNALKFMPAGREPMVRVTARTEGGLAQVEVADNGIGIDADDLPKLFKPFQRLHTRRRYDGTGLGLALVRQIAEAHGGSVSLRSQPGDGTTALVSLPLPGAQPHQAAPGGGASAFSETA